MNVEELVLAFQEEFAGTSPTPERLAEAVVQLSALLGTINSYILTAEVVFNKKLLEELNTEKAANKARIKAETSGEWIAYRKLKNLREVTIEMIRAAKYSIREQSEERREARY